MKRPNPINYIIPTGDDLDHEEYEREKDKYIDYLEAEHKELLEIHEYTKQQNLDVHLEWKELNDKNKELIKDANEADHADYCMCRFCAPEFHKLKTPKK